MTAAFLLLAIALSALPGCIEPRLRPYVNVHDMSPTIDELRALAEQGNAEDQYQLGRRYELAMPADYREAVRWYRSAAVQRHAGAFYRLCALSDIGRGVTQDYEEALRWCRLAADHGHGRAMFTIGFHYQYAHGVPRDLVQAHQWYNLAGANGYHAATKWRDRLAADMTRTQIAQAQFLARNWKPNSRAPPAESP